jgi:hypothetical protein
MDMDRPANIQNDRNQSTHELYSLLIMISTPKKVEEMANYALANGAVGAFFSYARGTLPNHILSILGLANVKREIAVLAVPSSMASSLLDNINRTILGSEQGRAGIGQAIANAVFQYFIAPSS